ncbi:MAG: class II aldolase/adducin family protein [Chloroflexota bacterium]
MKKEEGVIKFQMDYTPTAPLPPEQLRQINAWRKITYLLQLIGQEAGRYGGYGFGNISRRLEPFDAPETRRRFVISGTQTGGLAELSAGHYAIVTAYYPEQNRLVAEGPIRPSSESLTHGMIYDLDNDLRWVIHAHSPQLWRHAAALELPLTDPAVAYGTPEMAVAVRRLFAETEVRARLIFAMGGHEDGIVSFGRTAEEAGGVMLNYLARALAMD